MPEVTWKDLAEVVERISRLEERLQSINDELKSMQTNLGSVENVVRELVRQLNDTRALINTNISFYRKLAFRTILIIVAALATGVSSIILRLVG